MKINLYITGGTDKAVRANLEIAGEICGNLQIERSNFTKFCELLYGESGYSIVEQQPMKVINNAGK